MGDAYFLLGDAYTSRAGKTWEILLKREPHSGQLPINISGEKCRPSTAQQADKRLSDYASQYPDGEECFFRTLNDGDSYHVKGCINEYTTVRSRK
jgi:hypothetical protein